MAKIKKAQTGAGVPKGYVRGEMSEGRLYKKADQDKWDTFAESFIWQGSWAINTQ